MLWKSTLCSFMVSPKTFESDCGMIGVHCTDTAVFVHGFKLSTLVLDKYICRWQSLRLTTLKHKTNLFWNVYFCEWKCSTIVSNKVDTSHQEVNGVQDISYMETTYSEVISELVLHFFPCCRHSWVFGE